jgi:uncharacterized protein
MLEFEFDPAKSAANLAKHGIDFTAGQCWSAVVTYRDENVRIISVRRSREGEIAIYEG